MFHYASIIIIVYSFVLDSLEFPYRNENPLLSVVFVNTRLFLLLSKAIRLQSFIT